MKKSTIPIRFEPMEDNFNANHEPIYLTSSFRFESAEQAYKHFVKEEPGYIYSRFTNPNVELFQKRLAKLENGNWCIATASGMAACSTLFLTLLKAGDHLVCAINVFGSTITQIKTVLARFDISFTFVDGKDINAWECAIQPNTKLFFCETPSNPLCELIDIEALGRVAHAHQIYLAVDNCLASPVSQNPLDFGADFVLHSATKHIDGHGRCLGGAIVGQNDRHRDFYQFIRCTGPTLSAMNAWMLLDGLQTLQVRFSHECKTALSLATWLESHKKVSKVHYPGLPSHPMHALAKKQQSYFGNIVSFELKDGQREGAWKLIDAVRLLSITANLGDIKTSITHPATTTHGRLTEQERSQAGISESLVRISVGLEDVQDIQGDLEQALLGL